MGDREREAQRVMVDRLPVLAAVAGMQPGVVAQREAVALEAQAVPGALRGAFPLVLHVDRLRNA